MKYEPLEKICTRRVMFDRETEQNRAPTQSSYSKETSNHYLNLSQEVKIIKKKKTDNNEKPSAIGHMRDLNKNSNTLVVFTYNLILFIIILYAQYFKYKKCYVEQNITAFQKSPRVLSLTTSV